MTVNSRLEVMLSGGTGEPVRGATVTASPEAAGPVASAEFNAEREVYTLSGLRPGFFRLTAEHPDYLPQTLRIQVHPRPTELSITLLPEAAAHTFRGETRVAYDSRPELLGVIPAPASAEAADAAGQSLAGLLKSLGLEPAEDTPLDDGSEGSPALRRRSRAFPGALIVRRTELFDADDPRRNEDLRALRQSPLVEAAGPLFRQSGSGFSVFTNRLIVRFLPEITRAEALELLGAENLSVVEDVPFGANLFVAAADPSIGEGINRVAGRLVATGKVVYAEPDVAEVPEPDQIVPTDFLWPGGWDRQLVGAHDAWQRLRDARGAGEQYGSPRIIIAVVDEGIKSTSGVADNPDFLGNVSSGDSKVYKLFDFRRLTADNDVPLGDHGVACAGIAAAAADNTPAGSATGEGVAGAAPNARLMGLIFPGDEMWKLEMYIWAAGLRARSPRPGFPAPISPGADIFSTSYGFGADAELSGAARDMFDYITSRGRNGKGCIAIFSAGNSRANIENRRPYGAYERSFSCAASTLGPAGGEERAPYSGWGKVAWCAPSNSGDEAIHNPPNSYATWSASFLNEGNLPSFPETVTQLADDANPGDTQVRVASVEGLGPNVRLFLGEPGAPGGEATVVTGVPDPATGIVPVASLSNSHRAPARVIAGRNHHRNDFGGTSSATPLSAGVCALLLSASPRLTWVEVREILRATAVKFNTSNNDTVGHWLDADGRPCNTSGRPPVFSRWYGFGRLDADAAVAAALAYTFPRDLMLRKSLTDQGDAPTAPSLDSPDVWVRNADPANDPGALPAGFGEAGPHQEPSRSVGRWVYARVSNRGAEPSLDAWVRFYVASASAAPYRHPDDWEPMNGLGNRNLTVWQRGTYLIGEVALPPIPGGSHLIVNMPWPDGLMPPDTAPDGSPWGPHLLVEVTPHDGPLGGALIHENNNLAAKAILVGSGDDAVGPHEDVDASLPA